VDRSTEGGCTIAANRKVLIAVAVVVVVAALAFAALVAPGFARYDYTQTNLGMFGTQQIRTDRFTGMTEIYGAGKWQPIEIQGDNMQVPQGTTIQVK
jgi:hypothetical protein